MGGRGKGGGAWLCEACMTTPVEKRWYGLSSGSVSTGTSAHTASSVVRAPAHAAQPSFPVTSDPTRHGMALARHAVPPYRSRR
jgi:hypothetical protein